MKKFTQKDNHDYASAKTLFEAYKDEDYSVHEKEKGSKSLEFLIDASLQF